MSPDRAADPNVLANLVLVGPALVLSDVIVAYLASKRSDKRATIQLGLLGLLLNDCIKVANTYLATLGTEVRCASSSVLTSGGEVDLRGVHRTIQEALRTVVQAEKDVYESSAGDRKYSQPFGGDATDFPTMPNFAAVHTTVMLLDREIHCPYAVLAASTAEQFSRDCYVDFVFEGRGSMFRPLGEGPPRIHEPKIGFGEISVWLERANRIRNASVTIDLGSYNEFTQGCLLRAEAVLERVIASCPESLLPRLE